MAIAAFARHISIIVKPNACSAFMLSATTKGATNNVEQLGERGEWELSCKRSEYVGTNIK